MLNFVAFFSLICEFAFFIVFLRQFCCFLGRFDCDRVQALHTFLVELWNWRYNLFNKTGFFLSHFKYTCIEGTRPCRTAAKNSQRIFLRYRCSRKKKPFILKSQLKCLFYFWHKTKILPILCTSIMFWSTDCQTFEKVFRIILEMPYQQR